MAASLNTRVVTLAGVALALGLLIIGVVLDHAFRDAALAASERRLQGTIYMLLGLVDWDAAGVRPIIEATPDEALATPESGRYAQISWHNGDLLWRSPSMLGLAMPLPQRTRRGEFLFEENMMPNGERIYCSSYRIVWEGRARERSDAYDFQACESQAVFRTQIGRFRRSLMLLFTGLGVAMLIVQTGILRWGLRPLRAVAEELRAIEAGDKSALTEDYPRELLPLTADLNAMIHSQNGHVQRQRHALGDLAHSLKTPLSVLRTVIDEAEFHDPANHQSAKDQIDNMQYRIDYQLQRAATLGQRALSPGLLVQPIVDRIIESLQKVYRDRNLEITTSIEPGARFFGDEGDLMEIVGNLGDNACKWARARIQINAYIDRVRRRVGRDALVLVVADDGPGIPAEKIDEVLNRGARLDESVAGQGIGLAIVREIVEEGYHGRIDISSKGGAQIRVVMRFD